MLHRVNKCPYIPNGFVRILIFLFFRRQGFRMINFDRQAGLLQNFNRSHVMVIGRSVSFSDPARPRVGGAPNTPPPRKKIVHAFQNPRNICINISIACFVILPVLMLTWSRICLSQHNLARYIWFSAIEIRHCIILLYHNNLSWGHWFSHHYPATLAFVYTYTLSFSR